MFTELEQKQLFLSLRRSFVYAVKFNKSSTFNIKHVCDIMVNDSMGEPVIIYQTFLYVFIKTVYVNALCIRIHYITLLFITHITYELKLFNRL